MQLTHNKQVFEVWQVDAVGAGDLVAPQLECVQAGQSHGVKVADLCYLIV